MKTPALVVVLAFTMVAAACAPQAAPATEAPQAAEVPADDYSYGDAGAEMKAAVTVRDQAPADGAVTIDSVYMTAAGWVVIHTEAEGKPGPVIGYAALPAGESKDVRVEIDESKATGRLFAMLHVDAGVVGTYEFPGDDAPVKDGEMIVMAPFTLEGS